MRTRFMNGHLRKNGGAGGVHMHMRVDDCCFKTERSGVAITIATRESPQMVGWVGFPYPHDTWGKGVATLEGVTCMGGVSWSLNDHHQYQDPI